MSRDTGSADFEMGIIAEIINFIALSAGRQIVLCKTHRKKSNHIFLLPKTSTKSDFKPTPAAWGLVSGPLDRSTTRYVATIEYMPIPGTTRSFWEEMAREGEFDLWDIREGPLEYFRRSKRVEMLFWLLRVYEMPFSIREVVDFDRLPRGNAKIVNGETLDRIQSGFAASLFTQILLDREFEGRKAKIASIALKHSG